MDASVMDTTGDDPPKRSSSPVIPDGNTNMDARKEGEKSSDLVPLITLVRSVQTAADIPAAFQTIVERNTPKDDLMTAVYIVAKSHYHAWAKKTAEDNRSATGAKHAAISDLVSQLVANSKLDLDTIERFMDHETRCVVQFSCMKNNEYTAIGLDRVDQILSLASSPPHPPSSTSSNVAPQVLATFVAYFISVYNLDPSVVVEKVLLASANSIPYPSLHATHIPGGFDGNQMDDPYALIFHDIRLSDGARAIMRTFQPDLVESTAETILGDGDKRAEKRGGSSTNLPILPPDRKVLLGYALVRDAILPVRKVVELFEDKKARDEAWKKYSDKAADLAENGAYITKPRDLGRNRPSPPHDCWKTAPSDRDIFLLEEFLDVGPWHECGPGNLPLLELELLVLFIRCCRWKEAAEIFKYIEAANKNNNNNSISDIDLVAHAPVAKALSNLALAMLQGLLSEHFEFQYPKAKERYEAMRSLDKTFVSPVDEHSQLFNNEGGVFAEILFKLGSHSRRNPALIFAVIRLIQEEDIGDENNNTMVSRYLQYVLLPALQLTTANSALSLSIWKIIREAPHTLRWNMYRYCQVELPKSNVQIAVSNAHATYETRSVMKRVTVDTFDNFQRTMAKISAGQALSLGAAFIRRIQGYAPDKKTLEPFVQMLSMATPLSLDMLMYLIVEALNNDTKDKMKTDGTNFEMWFAATSLLAGIFLRKAKIESCSFDGMLTFLKRRIVDNKDAAYVEVLKDIVLCVTEIDVPRSLTTRQQKARAGGKHIRDAVQGCLDKATDKSTPGTVIDIYLEKECRKASLALKKSLLHTNTHYELAMGIAQCASAESLPGQALPVKARSTRKDHLRGALYQFVHMIDTLDNFSVAERRTAKGSNNDEMWARFKKTDLEELNAAGLQPIDYFGMVRPILNYPEGLPIVKKWAEERAETCQFKPELVRSFWTLDLADLHVPEKLYESEMQRFKRCIAHWENCLHLRKVERGQKYRAGKELDRFTSVHKRLAEELKDGIARERTVSRELSERAKELGSSIIDEAQKKKRMDIMKEFATQCIIPRAKGTAADAMFCVRFMLGINKINKGGALDMPELIKYLIQSTQEILEGATECDADNFSVLIAELLTMMDAWRSNRKAFDADIDKHGFKSSDGAAIWRHEVYCNYAFEMHRSLTKGCENLLNSSEYLHVRNGLTLLHLVSDVFPKIREHATTIMESVQKVTKSEKEDLKLSATRVLGTLKNGEAKRVPVHIFKLQIKKSTGENDNNDNARGVKRSRDEQGRQGNNNSNSTHPSKRLKSPQSPVSPPNRDTKNNSKRPRTPENVNSAPSKRPRSDKRGEEDGGRGSRQQQSRRGSANSNNSNDKRRLSNEDRDGWKDRDGGRRVDDEVSRGREGRRDGPKDDGGREGRRDGDRDVQREGPKEPAREGRRNAPRNGRRDWEEGAAGRRDIDRESPGRDVRRNGSRNVGGIRESGRLGEVDRRREGSHDGVGGREGGRHNDIIDNRRNGIRDGDSGGREGGRVGNEDSRRERERDLGGVRGGRPDSAHNEIGMRRDSRHGRVTDRLGRVGGGRERYDNNRSSPWNQERPRSPRDNTARYMDEENRRHMRPGSSRLDQPLGDRHHQNIEPLEHRNQGRRNNNNNMNNSNADHRNNNNNNRHWNNPHNPQYDERFDSSFDRNRRPPPRRRRGGQDRRPR